MLLVFFFFFFKLIISNIDLSLRDLEMQRINMHFVYFLSCFTSGLFAVRLQSTPLHFPALWLLCTFPVGWTVKRVSADPRSA